MATDDWLERIGRIRQWSRQGERAPHKPLLLLCSLGRLHQTKTSRAEYSEAEPSLARLLRELGPGGRPSTPAYPFHHLQTDGLWVVETTDGTHPGANPGRRAFHYKLLDRGVLGVTQEHTIAVSAHFVFRAPARVPA